MSEYGERNGYNMPLTLEQHFEELAARYPSVHELFSLWVLLKKRIEDELLHSRGVFVTYSLHDGSHSRSVLQAIERFLGEERIRKLSATDTFMLLACAYTHDYGMAQTFNRVYNILGSRDFENFLKKMDSNSQSLEKEDAWAIHNLLTYLNDEKATLPLNDIYLSIILVIQLYIRPLHWKGVSDIENDFQGLYQGYVKGRFVHGSEGIIPICMCHGQSMKSLLHLSQRADGMAGDDYHPRFIAAMLRLGDLLDLDNGRFPLWFVKEISESESNIPKLSVMNYRKHEAVSHLLITHKKIEIKAECKAEEDGYEVAGLVNEWTNLLEEECRQMVIYWNEIAQPDFGRPPGDVQVTILVDDHPYESFNKKMQMRMSQERVMKLLEGTSIYQDKYVGIREMIQNAVDASLLQLWYDITQNRYLSYGLSKNTAKKGLDFLDLLHQNRTDIFGNYDITVEVIKDLSEKKVHVVVKDKGIGITPEDVEFIADIGSSKEKNVRVKGLMEHMPKWLKPAGIFGIGLQSVFQLTDCVEFYTRQHNAPERCILLYSYGKNRGKIEVREVPPNEDGLFYDNAVPGTNVKIAIDPEKLLGKGGVEKNHFIYYDPEFDTGEELDVIYAEICRVCEKKIKESKCDYFNIYYQSMIRHGIEEPDKGKKICYRRSYFTSGKKMSFGENFDTTFKKSGNEFSFIINMACFWDKTTSRCYHLSIRPCKIVEKEGIKRVYLPEPIPNLYNISYKFSSITNAETIYSQKNNLRCLHAGFLKWNILILDDDTTKYLNIDRDRLRENAIHEEELVEIRKEILERWCEYFCSFDISKAEKLFNGSPEVFLSLILLFYQNVPEMKFQKFMEPYQPLVEKINLVLGEEHLPFTYFWDKSRTFQYKLPLPLGFRVIKPDVSDAEVTEISTNLVRHLPHRLVNIEAVYSTRDLELLHHIRLRKPDSEPNAVYMSEAARLYDYMNVFDAYENQQSTIDYSTVLKKVFKPNGKYIHLLMPCYPRTFQKGSNFSGELDYYIRWYILSPFDQDAAKILKSGLEEGKNIVEELKQHVSECRQMEKCINYILKYRFSDEPEKDVLKGIIKNEYLDFTEDFCRLLCKNRGLVKEQFKKNKNK